MKSIAPSLRAAFNLLETENGQMRGEIGDIFSLSCHMKDRMSSMITILCCFKISFIPLICLSNDKLRFSSLKLIENSGTLAEERPKI
jgi:hypothetical protein